MEDQCQGWRLRHRRRRRALGRALDGDLCAATECPARGGRPGQLRWRGHRGRVGAGTVCLRMRGLPTGGSAAPGGLPPVGRGMLPPRSRRVPLLPAWRWRFSSAPARDSSRLTSASLHATSAGPGLAWRAEGVPLKPWRKLSQLEGLKEGHQRSPSPDAQHGPRWYKWLMDTSLAAERVRAVLRNAGYQEWAPTGRRGFQVEGDPQGGWVVVTCIPGVRRHKGQLDLQKYREILSAAGFNVTYSPHVSGVLRVTLPPEAGNV